MDYDLAESSQTYTHTTNDSWLMMIRLHILNSDRLQNYSKHFVLAWRSVMATVIVITHKVIAGLTLIWWMRRFLADHKTHNLSIDFRHPINKWQRTRIFLGAFFVLWIVDLLMKMSSVQVLTLICICSGKWYLLNMHFQSTRRNKRITDNVMFIQLLTMCLFYISHIQNYGDTVPI